MIVAASDDQVERILQNGFLDNVVGYRLDPGRHNGKIDPFIA